MKILHVDSNDSLLIDELNSLGYINDIDLDSSKKDIEDKIHEYGGIVIRSRFEIDANFIDKAKQLKFIARAGSGLERIDTKYAQSKGIHLISAPEANRNAVGEHVLGLVLSLFNNFKKADLEIRKGKWLREENRGLELDGQCVGIIGYGNTGKSFAKKLKGFDLDVFCYDIKEKVGDENAIQVDLKTIRDKSTLISLHTCENEKSYKIINDDFIKKCKHPFYLFNTSRGSCVDTKALLNGIEKGKILGAGLDVLEYEQSSFEGLFEENKLNGTFKKLIKSEKILLTPHVAGWTFQSKIKIAKSIANKIKAIGTIP